MLAGSRDREQMGLWSRGVRIGGWVCAIGSALVLINLLLVLVASPEEWRPTAEWQGADEVRDLMHADLLLGWFGWWGYAAHIVWAPIAIVRGRQGWRKGLRPTAGERSLVLVDLCSLVGISALVHLTWLRYPSFNVPLL